MFFVQICFNGSQQGQVILNIHKTLRQGGHFRQIYNIKSKQNQVILTNRTPFCKITLKTLEQLLRGVFVTAAPSTMGVGTSEEYRRTAVTLLDDSIHYTQYGPIKNECRMK